MGEKHTSIVSIDGMAERTIYVNGFSKKLCHDRMASSGYVAAPKEIMQQMLKIHQFAIMCSPTTSQYAAIEALKKGDEDIKKMREEYDYRRRRVVDGFRTLACPASNRRELLCVSRHSKHENDFIWFLRGPLNKEKGCRNSRFCLGASGEGFIRCPTHIPFPASMTH